MTVSAAELLGWYDVARRDLPWREPGVTAWQILVSEFMLQQTPVSRVQPIWLDLCHAGLRRRPLTPIGLVRSQLSSSRCTSAAGFALGTPVSCQPATGGTSVTSGCGAKPATY